MTRTQAIAAFALCMLVSGCAAPPEIAQVQRDVSRHRADCTITQHGVGEGDDEHIYIEANLNCTGNPASRTATLGYRHEGKEWRLFHIAFDGTAVTAPQPAKLP